MAPCKYRIQSLLSFRLFVSLCSILLLPSFLFVFFHSSSLAFGLLLSSFIVVLLNFDSFINAKFKLPSVLFVFAVLIVFFTVSLFFYFVYNETKPILSMSLFSVFVAAFSLGNTLNRIDFPDLSKVLFYVVLLLMIFGWLKLIWIPDFGGYSILGKPVFPFSEESHYALALGLVSCSYVISAPFKRALFVISNILVFSLLYPSLILLVFAMCCILMLSLRYRYSLVVFTIVLLPLILNLLFFYKIDYFWDRLNILNTTNLTALVYVQGWQLAYLNTINTGGVGLGFQMLGADGTYYPPVTSIIYSLTGDRFNISDGGFLAAKLISEYGVVGLLICLVYFIFLIRFVWRSSFELPKLILNQNSRLLVKNYTLGALIFGFLVEFFFRGIGYFSPTLLIVIAAIIANRLYHKNSC